MSSFSVNSEARLSEQEDMTDEYLTYSAKKAGNLAVGERLSPCGKFAINTAGEWRELAGKDQVATTPEMVAVDPEGKQVIQELK